MQISVVFFSLTLSLQTQPPQQPQTIILVFSSQQDCHCAWALFLYIMILKMPVRRKPVCMWGLINLVLFYGGSQCYTGCCLKPTENSPSLSPLSGYLVQLLLIFLVGGYFNASYTSYFIMTRLKILIVLKCDHISHDIIVDFKHLTYCLLFFLIHCSVEPNRRTQISVNSGKHMYLIKSSQSKRY